MSKLNLGEAMNEQATLERTNMTVTGVKRGESAYADLLKADPTIAPAPDGYDYIIADVKTNMTALIL
jgi:hypothetical protein